MDNFNRIASFVLGLVVVIVFLAVISGRLGFGSKVLNRGQAKISPTTTVIPTEQIQPYVSPTSTGTVPGYVTPTRVVQNNGARPPTTIPSTGSPTLILPLLFSALGSGLYLRRKTQRG